MNRQPNNTIPAKPITIIQLNCNKKGYTIHSLLNQHIHDTDILLLQEPSWGRIGADMQGADIRGPIGHRSWIPLLPYASYNLNDKQPRVMLYYRQRDGLEVALHSDLVRDRDIQVIDVIYPGQPTTMIINIYNDPTRLDNNAIRILQNLDLPTNRPVILTGDWNIHHAMWANDTRRYRTNHQTETLVNWLTIQGFQLVNTPGVATYAAHSGRGLPSVIDLTFANGQAAQHLVPYDWAVRRDLSYGSDHFALQWTLFHNAQPINNLTAQRYNTKDTNVKEWTKRLAENLKHHYAPLTLLTEPNRTLSTQELEDAATALTETISTTNEQAARVRKPSEIAKPWWNTELSKIAEEIQELRELQLLYLEEHQTRDQDIVLEIKRLRNFFKRSCRFAKAEWANTTLAKAQPDEVWGFRKWASGIRSYPMPALDRGPNTTPATSHQEKCDTLRNTLYQPPPPLPDPIELDLSRREPNELPFQDITETEVHEALFSTNSNTSPGPSQISYTMLKWAWPIIRTELTTLIQKCLARGYHPQQWRRATAVALRKPNKPDYSKPRAYRLITLLECMGKLLEKIVAHRLTYMIGRYKLIAGAQCGGRANHATTDALLSFVHDLQTAWNHGKVTSALTFDIKGYFDFVNHNRLIAEMQKRQIPLEYLRWTKSFLSQRKAAICVDGARGEMSNVENGIPQGSPASPILASLYSAGLLDLFKPNPNTDLQGLPLPDEPTATTLFMYVDDGKLTVSSKSLETNVKLLAAAYYRVNQWLQKAGLTLDKDKRELMHYTRRQQDGSPAIRLPENNGTISTIPTSSTVRWLGVYFDRKLLFNKHIAKITSKAEAAVASISMLANTIRGLSHYHLRQLYQTCILPVISYASVVWWTGKKRHAQAISKVQNRAIRLICAAFRTTPIHALEIEASIPPIPLFLDSANKRAAIRFNKLSTNNPILQRLPNEWRTNNNSPPPLPNLPKSRKKPNTTQLLQVANNTSPSNERIFPFLLPPWRRPLTDFGNRFYLASKPLDSKDKAAQLHQSQLQTLQTNNANIIVYTDGSQRSIHQRFRRVGAAAVGYIGQDEVFTAQLGLGGRAEVYDAELTGLLIGLHRAQALCLNNPAVNHIILYSDNTSALSTICDPKPRKGQLLCYNFYKKAIKWLDQSTNHRITLAWCPGHSDIRGNERADKLAKAATEQPGTSDTTTTYMLRRTRERTTEAWTKAWKNHPQQGRYAQANRIPPSLRPTPHFENLRDKRELFGRLIQCRTGHGYLGDFYMKADTKLNPACPCGEPYQTHTHILRDCCLYRDHCHILEKISPFIYPSDILGTHEGI